MAEDREAELEAGGTALLRGGRDAELPWPTVDGPLGVHRDNALKQARLFFYAGFFLLPWLWFVNCFYFWPVLRHRRAEPHVRPYVVWSGVGFLVYTTLLLSWAVTFSIGRERVFGSLWKQLAVYDIADRYQLVGDS